MKTFVLQKHLGCQFSCGESIQERQQRDHGGERAVQQCPPFVRGQGVPLVDECVVSRFLAL